jgi:hypothetical protein
MRWVPTTVTGAALDLARAIERQFAPRVPDRPVRLPTRASAELIAASAALDPYGAVINTDTKKLAYSLPDGSGGYAWFHADGSAAP